MEVLGEPVSCGHHLCTVPTQRVAFFALLFLGFGFSFSALIFE